MLTTRLGEQGVRAGGNLRTSNYRSGFVTLDPATELTVVNNQTSGSYDLQTIAFSQDFDTGTTGQAVLALQFRWDMSQQAPVTSIGQGGVPVPTVLQLDAGRLQESDRQLCPDENERMVVTHRLNISLARAPG